MQHLIHLFEHSKHLHHAYFVVGHKIEDIVSKLKHFLENHVGISVSGNPDFTHRKFSTMTIDHTRDIIENEGRKSLGNGKRIFILEVESITLEAQNSLLKVFEEPALDTHFFLISPQDTIIPTLRGRMQVFFDDYNIQESSSILKLDLNSRLKKVKEITDNIKDEEGTKQDAIDFLNKIEMELHQSGILENKHKLLVCDLSRRALYDRGAPVKMILENLVLSV